MINDLNSKLADFTEEYENKVLEKALPDETTEKYKNSRALTQKIADALFESPNLMSSYASFQNAKIANARTQYDLLIQQGETLELLMKINRATEALKPDMILSQVDEVVTFLKDEVLDKREHGKYILEKLKKNEAIYGDFLLKLVQENTYMFFHNIEYFISDCTLPNKKEIALEMVKHDMGAVSLVQHLDKFSFTEEERKEIAFAIAKLKEGAKCLAENIDKFSISGEEDRKEIALAIAEHEFCAEILARNIDSFAVTKEGDKKTIALAIVRHESGADSLAENFAQFSFTNEEDRKEIALAIAKHERGAESLAENFAQFSLSNEEDRKEIALLIAGDSWAADALAENIGEFSINNEENRKEIAFALVRNNGLGAAGLAANFNDFSITDESIRKALAFEIAKYELGAQSLARNIAQFSLTNEEDLKEIALAIAWSERGAESLAGHLSEFSLAQVDQKEIALRLAEHEVAAFYLAENVADLSFDNEQDLKEIVFAIIKHETVAASLVGDIDKLSLDIADQKQIALSIAEHERGAASLAHNFAYLPFVNQADRKEIALAVAQRESGATVLAKKITGGSLENEADRKEIALEIAKHDVGAASLAYNLSKFSIKNEEERKEIALAIAKHELGAHHLAKNINVLFNFTRASDQKEIALAVAGHGYGAKEIVKDILILFSGEADRKEMALTMLQHARGAKNLIKNYKRLKIEDSNFEREAIRMAFRWPSSLEAVKSHLRESKALKGDLSLDLMRRCPARSDLSRTEGMNKRKKVLVNLMGGKWEKTQKAVKSLSEKVDSDDSNFKTIEAFYDLDSAKRPKFQDYKKACNKLSRQFRGSKETKDWAKLPEALIQEGQYWASVYDVIEQIAKLNDFDLQYLLTHWMAYFSFHLNEANRGVDTGTPAHAQVFKMIYNVRDHDLRYHLADLFAEQMSDQKDLKALMTPPFAALTKLLLYDLQKIHPEIKFDKFTKSLTTRFLKDGEKQKILYSALWGLKQSKKVSSEQINDILEHLSGLDSEGLVHELRALNSIISLEKEDRISITDKKEKPLTKSLSDAFAELLPGLNISDPSRFSDLYFGSRVPGSLAVYVAGLLKLPPSESETLLKIVKTFVEEVDGGSFLTSRYQDSDHLNRIAEADPNILKKWKTGKKEPLTDYLEGNSDPDVVKAIINSLKVKIVTDRHLPIERLPLVAQAYGKKVDSSEPFKALDTLLFDLIQNPDLLTADYLDKILIELKTLPKDEVLVFAQDIEFFKQELKPKAAKKIERWQIVDSDDPLDLFLSGTEVGGSCQRVDGTPSLNKALMGYVMDGKHRILAVKDSQGKIVERMILRLLLDDKTNEPVLFFERIYPETAKYGDALKNFAKVRAKELGVPLVSKETRAETNYEGSLVSYSSKAPYEYSDAAEGIQTGTFKITGCYQIAPASRM